MPASTSSKISVWPELGGGGERLERQHHPRQLAARRDTSERPELLAGIRRQVELPRVNPRARTTATRIRPGRSRTSNRVRSMASSASSTSSAVAKVPGGGATATDRSRAASKERPPGLDELLPRSPRPTTPHRSTPHVRRPGRSRLAMTSSSVGPCLRFSRSRSARRSSTLVEPSGRGVDAVAVSPARSSRDPRAAP